jgi:hypothetical protein
LLALARVATGARRLHEARHHGRGRPQLGPAVDQESTAELEPPGVGNQEIRVGRRRERRGTLLRCSIVERMAGEVDGHGGIGGLEYALHAPLANWGKRRVGRRRERRGTLLGCNIVERSAGEVDGHGGVEVLERGARQK